MSRILSAGEECNGMGMICIQRRRWRRVVVLGCAATRGRELRWQTANIMRYVY
jgi:hypothetical protein